MAFFVSISLSIPLSAANFPPKDLQLRKAPLATLSSQTTVGTEINLLIHCCSDRDTFSVRNRCGYLTPIHRFGETFSSCKNVRSCNHKTIIGYWIGPDIDDGWGYVEASVNPIT